jgi:hypothetical protein
MDLTGKTVLVANASTGDSDTTAANTAFVQQEIAALVASAPGTLNTLNELAAALGDDASFSTTVTNSIATKLPLAGGTMTGDLITTGLTVDTTTLVVDKTNNRVGIGTASPNVLLHLSGSGAQAFLENSDTTGNGSHDFSVTANKPGIGYNNYNHGGYKHVFKTGGSQTIAAIIDESGAATFNSTISAVGSANSSSASHIPAFLGSGDYGGGVATRDGTESGWYQQTNGADWHFYHNRTVASQSPESKKVLSFNSTGEATFSGNVTFGGTGAIIVTNGTTAQRPASPTAGMVRYNTTKSSIEYYNGVWAEVATTALIASGGTVSTITGYKIHTFTSSGSLVVSQGCTAEILIVASGGNGATSGGGGGGGGGILYNPSKLLTSGTYTVIVGGGGGSNSSFGTMVAIGGGSGSGQAGGSGGGQGHQSPSNPIGALSTQPSADGMGYGNAGGGHTYVNPYPSGGGGGAGGPGGIDAFNSTGRDGFAGPGKKFGLSGTTTYYSGGGGGGYYYGGPSNAGGLGGGGATGVNNGGANTGGGGGGGATVGLNAGTGGSGIVIVRYVV